MYSVVNSVNNDDCRQVSQLNEIPWRAVDNKMWNNKDIRPVISDFKLDIGWYSTVQNARHYVMSSHSAGLAIGSCGTAYPVYLKGKSVCVAQSLTFSGTRTRYEFVYILCFRCSRFSQFFTYMSYQSNVITVERN